MSTQASAHFASSELVEVVIGSGDEQRSYTLHEALICAKSPYFARCLASGMVEARERKVVLEDVDRRSFERLVNWIYTNQITLSEEEDHDWENVIDTYRLADRLCMEQLRNDTLDFIKDWSLEDGMHVAHLTHAWNGRLGTKLLTFFIREFMYQISDCGRDGGGWYGDEASQLLDLPREFAVSVIHGVYNEHRRRNFEKEYRLKHKGHPAHWKNCVFHDHVDTKPCEGGNSEPGDEEESDTDSED